MHASVEQPVFSVEQMISASVAGKQFGTVRNRAKSGPLLVLDRNEADTVILSYEEYAAMFSKIAALQECVIDAIAAERLNSEYRPIPIEEAIGEDLLDAPEVRAYDNIPDSELFE